MTISLVRKYAYQVLLVDEFRRAGVEVIFLNREGWGTVRRMICCSQVQGMMAEYERAKIVERHQAREINMPHALGW